MGKIFRWIVLCVAVLVGAACGSSEDGKQAGDAASNQPTLAADAKHACDVFTLDIARQILGESARKSEISKPFTGSSHDIETSTCTYEADNPAPASKFATVITATVLLKAAKTSTARRSNQDSFEQNNATFEESGEQVATVDGLQAPAWYIGGIVNQVHALIKDGEYELIASAMRPGGDSRAASEQLARSIIEQL